MEDVKISKHARERYVERVKGKNEKLDIVRYSIENEERLNKEISLMVKHGTLIYKGIQRWDSTKPNANTLVEVYIDKLWLLIVDSKSQNVITVFKVTLGLDEEFDLIYVNKLLSKLEQAKAKSQEVKENLQKSNQDYKNIIEDFTNSIKEYRTKINQLQTAIDGYNAVITSNNIQMELAEDEVIDVIGVLLAKKRF